MKKIVARVLVVIFVLIAIFITANILAYNDYEVAEFGNKSWILADEHMKEYGYNKGDLIIADKSTIDDLKANDEILYYDIYAPTVTINKGKIVEISDDGSQYYMDNNIRSAAKRNVLGSVESLKVYPKVGGVLEVLENRTGYLVIIILPTLGLFAYLIRKITVELKEDKKK